MKNYTSFKDRMRQRHIATIQARPQVKMVDDFSFNTRTGRFTSNKSNATEVDKKPLKVEYMLEENGLKVILTDHARQQLKRRYDLPIERQKSFFLQCVSGLQAQNWEPEFENHEIFIYSKSMKQGCIAAFRRDFKADTDKMCMVIVTFYPKGRRKGMQSDTKVIYV